MNFCDYRAEIEHILSRKHINSNLNMEAVFEAYISDVTPREYIEKIKLTESKSDNDFIRYRNNIIKLVKKYGYNIIKMPYELNEDLKNFYNDGYGISECVSYITEKLDKNTVPVKPVSNIDEILLYNRLLYVMHDIPDAAIVDIDKKSDCVYAILRVKLYDLRNELNTDIKSYLAEVHKNFSIYLKQNVDNITRIDIKGYSANQKSVYCTVSVKLDFIVDEENPENMDLSIKETSNTINMYVNIFKMFGEQYRNLI